MKQNQFGLGGNEAIIETPSLLIKKNIMTWGNTAIQLSNVSYISAADIAESKFPWPAALLVLVGFMLVEESFLLFLMLATAGGAWIYYWYKENEKRRNGAILTIRMNSGHNVYFTFQEKEFLFEVLKVLENIIINGGASSPVDINIKDCTINNSKILSDFIS